MSASRHRIDLPSGWVDVFYEPGARPAVALIHGNSASKDVFASQVAMLRGNGFGVLALDLPGHGASDDARNPAETYSFTGYARTVGQVLDAFALETVHVAGWSLGGHVGLELMARDPRVTSLLIWGTPPVRPSRDFLRDAFLPSDGMGFASAAVLSDEEIAIYGAAMVGVADPPQVVLDAIRRTDGQARAQMIANGMAGVGVDARDLVERDPRPLAVLHGDDDPFVNVGYLTAIAYRNLWRGAVQILPGVGHAAHWQTPEIFNTLLLSFLLSSSEKLSP